MKHDTPPTWESIRANWVNGNLKDAKHALTEQPTRAALYIVLEAARTAYDHIPNGTTMSGDLVDLIEILKSIDRESE